jgi:hypothetical protein
MKVGELIDLLSEFDRDLEVITEGCDCMGIPNGVEIYNGLFKVGPDKVLITRED